MSASLQTLYSSASVGTGTTTSSSVPCDCERVVALYVAATAGSGTVTVTLQTSHDGTTWYDTVSTLGLASGASSVIALTVEDGLGRYYRAKAVVATAATTFSVHAVAR